MSIEWAEDDGLPSGVVRVDCEGPKDGKTYVMYHGTKRANVSLIRASGFRQSSGGMLGRGVYLSRDLQKASGYPIGHPERDRVVIKVQVNVGKVKAIDRQNHPLQKTWHEEGYDTAWVPPNCGMVSSGREENCVWDPKRITILETIEPKPVRDTRAGSRPISMRELTYSLPDLPEHNHYSYDDDDDYDAWCAWMHTMHYRAAGFQAMGWSAPMPDSNSDSEGGRGRGGAGRGGASRGGATRGGATRGGAARGGAARAGAARGGAARGGATRGGAARGGAGRGGAARGGAARAGAARGGAARGGTGRGRASHKD